MAKVRLFIEYTKEKEQKVDAKAQLSALCHIIMENVL